MEQYVVFKSHQQHFALRIDYVVRVIEAASFTQLPEVADFVLGIQPIEEDELVLALELPFLFSYEQAAEMKDELGAYQTEKLAAANDDDNDDRE